ncbi:MAG TPA: zinc ribbon domain-containing protein [Nitrospira sp.]|nr:zinc ribbon domain-containing protein [Nitrospira sp.]
MAIIREYRCRDCGTVFESVSSDPECPGCVGEAERIFLTPPAIRHTKTNFADATIADLAAAHGLSDISNRDGQPVRRPAADNPNRFAGPEIVAQLPIPSGARDQLSPMLPMFRNPVNMPRTRLKS